MWVCHLVVSLKVFFGIHVRGYWLTDWRRQDRTGEHTRNLTISTSLIWFYANITKFLHPVATSVCFEILSVSDQNVSKDKSPPIRRKPANQNAERSNWPISVTCSLICPQWRHSHSTKLTDVRNKRRRLATQTDGTKSRKWTPLSVRTMWQASIS